MTAPPIKNRVASLRFFFRFCYDCRAITYERFVELVTKGLDLRGHETKLRGRDDVYAIPEAIGDGSRIKATPVEDRPEPRDYKAENKAMREWIEKAISDLGKGKMIDALTHLQMARKIGE